MKPIAYKGLGEGILERFLRYVKVDTQSCETSETVPSTAKQLDLAKIVAADLQALGVKQVEVDDKGYLYAGIPGNVPGKKIPAIALIAHFDTSPDVSGANVKPLVHKNYRGGPIQLPGDPHQVVDPQDSPPLKDCISHDIITSDGTTLLGADDKAGIAAILEVVAWLQNNPDFKHGPVRIAITPDEEVGRGADHINIPKMAADYAYTLDGSIAGEIEDETFCADGAVVKIQGRNIHPGYAKGKMVNALRVAADFIALLPYDTSPETTENKEGYLHPNSLSGGSVEACTLNILLRDFTVEGLKDKGSQLHTIAEKVRRKWPKAKIEIEIKEYYRNMKYKLDENPNVVGYAVKAIQQAGLAPIQRPIRGGTDGARFCYMGLLTPNLFAGSVNFHSKTEWVSLQTMQKSSEVVLNLLAQYRDRSAS